MKNKKLTVKVVNDELQISIGIDVLKFAAERCPLLQEIDKSGDCVNYEITDAKQFAKDVKEMILDEEEDGTTLLYEILDKVFVKVIDSGAQSINYDKLIKR